jgi:hypothetical protein
MVSGFIHLEEPNYDTALGLSVFIMTSLCSYLIPNVLRMNFVKLMMLS